MTNPLDSVQAARPVNRGFADMKIGETRTHMLPRAFDEKGKPDPASYEAFTLTRTTRPFICDWVDCVSNEVLDRKGRKDVRWWVDEQGEAHLLPIREYKRRVKL